ncbi:hypothetical protein GCM10010243_19880 [Streptomyces matensis]|nr:hypothetical protein GCM10010243_19880 [Streptomyces matensis]
MAGAPEGTPCWADAVFDDLDQAKDFYDHVLGWTFSETSPDQGGYTQAYADGKAVAAVVPPMPGQEGTSQWCLHLAARDLRHRRPHPRARRRTADGARAGRRPRHDVSRP